jgi:hypothetical protein
MDPSRHADAPDPGRNHPQDGGRHHLGTVGGIARPSLVAQVMIRTRFLALTRVARHTHGQALACR